MLAVALNFVIEQLTLALKELSRKIANFVRWENETGHTKYRAIVIARVGAADVGSYVPEFIEINNIHKIVLKKHESPRLHVGFGKEANQIEIA
jgi:hypothetical protein